MRKNIGRDELKRLNAARKDLKKELIEPKERKCLGCDQTFESIGDRLCADCHTANRNINMQNEGDGYVRNVQRNRRRHE